MTSIAAFLKTRLGLATATFAVMAIVVGLMAWQIDSAYEKIEDLAVEKAELTVSVAQLKAQREELQASLDKQNTEVLLLAENAAKARDEAVTQVKERIVVIEKRSPTPSTDYQEYNQWLKSLY